MSDLIKPAADAFSLRALTPARVSLRQAGTSLATCEILDFSMAHAQARDAVYARLECDRLMEEFERRGLAAMRVHSGAADRSTYIRRPDLGRMLDEASCVALSGTTKETTGGPRLTLILGDGLSALATNRHAMPLLDALLPRLTALFSLTCVVVAEQARVALGDPIGQLLETDLTIMLIGERPGLSSADSLGAYLTWKPRPGRTDAERNCVSNIRSEGLDSVTAAARIAGLCVEASRRRLTGTALKESSMIGALPGPAQP